MWSYSPCCKLECAGPAPVNLKHNIVLSGHHCHNFPDIHCSIEAGATVANWAELQLPYSNKKRSTLAIGRKQARGSDYILIQNFSLYALHLTVYTLHKYQIIITEGPDQSSVYFIEFLSSSPCRWTDTHISEGHIGRMSALNIVLGNITYFTSSDQRQNLPTFGVNCPIEIVNENHFLNICWMLPRQ